jgi:hypothetical protein
LRLANCQAKATINNAFFDPTLREQLFNEFRFERILNAFTQEQCLELLHDFLLGSFTTTFTSRRCRRARGRSWSSLGHLRGVFRSRRILRIAAVAHIDWARRRILIANKGFLSRLSRIMP